MERMRDLQFSGEVAWVTGSSKGIGRAISLGLAERVRRGRPLQQQR